MMAGKRMGQALLLLAGLALGGTALGQSDDERSCAGVKGTVEERIAACTRAIGSAPKERVAELYVYRGYEELSRGRYAQAIADYSAAIAHDSKHLGAYYNRGAAYHHERDYDKAIADFDQVIKSEPKEAMVYVKRGLAWIGKGSRRQANADFGEAIRLNPANADIHNEIAWNLAIARDDKVRDAKNAVRYATRACELTSWKDGNLIDTLAAAHAADGNFAEAVKWQEKALEFPDFASLHGAEGRERLALYKAGKPYREK